MKLPLARRREPILASQHRAGIFARALGRITVFLAALCIANVLMRPVWVLLRLGPPGPSQGLGGARFSWPLLLGVAVPELLVLALIMEWLMGLRNRAARSAPQDAGAGRPPNDRG